MVSFASSSGITVTGNYEVFRSMAVANAANATNSFGGIKAMTATSSPSHGSPLFLVDLHRHSFSGPKNLHSLAIMTNDWRENSPNNYFLCLDELQHIRRRSRSLGNRCKTSLMNISRLVMLKTILSLLWLIHMTLSPLLPVPRTTLGFMLLLATWIPDVLRRLNWKHHIKTAFYHFLRDSGLFRVLMDTVIFIGLPSLARQYPSARSDFASLTKQCIRIPYGNTRKKSQMIHLYLPEAAATEQKRIRGVAFFVHGGAWGSGRPWMYRLLAKPFLRKGLALAVVGYRSYPDAKVDGQRQDIESAAAALTLKYPELCLQETELGVIAIGHSSGAHLLGMMLLERLRRKVEPNQQFQQIAASDNSMRIDSFVGISAPYNIEKHFEFEASRGLEQLSPMQPVCGGKDSFEKNSPILQITRLLDLDDERNLTTSINKVLPARFAFLHGAIDETVPLESSTLAASLLRQAGVKMCDEMYYLHLGHSETILGIMFGGKIQNDLFDWIEAKTATNQPAPKHANHPKVSAVT